MPNRSRSLAAWMAAAVAVTLTACTSDSSGTTPAPRYPGLVQLSISPLDVTIPKGLDVQFGATGAFDDTTTSDVTAGVAWTSSDAAVAAFSADPGSEGRLLTSATGPVTVAASVDGLTSATTVTVLDAAIDSLEITPAAPTILVGSSLQLAATATLTDDTTLDLPFVSWASSDPATVTVGTDGTVTAQALGSATITATVPGTAVSASTLVTVTPIPGALSYVSVKPGSVVGGGTRTVIGTVALTSAPTLATTVTLASDSPAATPDPAQLVFDSTSAVQTFVVTTLAVDKRTKVTITATADGDVNAGVSKEATLRLRVAK